MAVQVLGKVAYFNKGAYNSQTNYEINDVVSYNGSSYVSLNDNNQGNLPTNTNYWSVVAEKGDKGDTGKPFVIEKTYSSIESMVADYDNMNVNDYVMIQGSIEEQENATLWTKREVEVSPYKWAYLADFSGASGITGATPNIHIGTVTEGNEPSVTRRSGSSNENPILDFVLKTGAKGDTGATGNGISSIEKTSTSGLVDTYTITFTNGTSTTIEVTNGRGIVSIAKTGTVDYVDTYTITYNDGTTSTFEVTNSEVTEEEFDEVVDELNYLYDDLPKVEGEGTSLTLDNTRKGKMSNVLKGNDLSQETTEGYNILETKAVTTTNNGITYTINSDGSVKVNGTASANSYFVLTNDSNNLGVYQTKLFTMDSNYYCTPQNDSSSVQMMYRTTEGAYHSYTTVGGKDIGLVYLTVNNGVTINDLVVYPMIVNGSSAVKPYEKFTGGNPAPNPDYPSNVDVVSGNNNISIETNNLFELNNDYLNASWDGGSPNTMNIVDNKLQSTANYQEWRAKSIDLPHIKPNNTYILSLDILSVTSSNGDSVAQLFTKKGSTPVVKVFEEVWKVGKHTKSFTIDDVDHVGLAISSARAGTVIVGNIQIEKGSTVTTYQKYEGETYPINLGTMELCKIGDYQDYIYKDNGKWYKHSEIDKIILNGSEVWEFDASSASAGNRFTCSNMGGSSFGGTVQIAKSNIVSYTPDVNNYGNYNNTFILRYISSKNRIDVISSLINNLTEWTNLLNQKNMVIYVPLATPTDTEITDQTLIAQLDNFEKALSYNTQTNISQENNDLPFIISASAFMSLKYLFGNLETRVAELETSEPSEL